MQDNEATAVAKGIAGAAIGGILGYAIFYGIAQVGFYAVLFIGFGVGNGFSYGYRRSSQVASIACGVVALIVSVVADWHVRSNQGLVDHVKNLQDDGVFLLAMIALSGLAGYWCSRDRAAKLPSRGEG